ncbi:SigE family RNA polymerase sigma factor [Streptomyces sp. NPDC050418]|uniref:SigE family RNA polymerase sigma factor n=1 Tax=Streptomyces sp. NPDC050418 TaxID=3365612 RepID=UPI00378C2A52
MGVDAQSRDEEFRDYATSRWAGLLRTAYLLTGDRHTAEDLVQTTLERAYASWRRVSQADSPDAYVRRILVNASARRHRHKLKELLPGPSGPPAEDEPAEPTDRYVQADQREVLWRALAGLPPRQRQAVVLRHWEDLSEAQTAEAMGCSVGTVKSQTAKGLAKLRAAAPLKDWSGRER